MSVIMQATSADKERPQRYVPWDTLGGVTYDSTSVTKRVDWDLAFLSFVQARTIRTRGRAMAGRQGQQQGDGDREGMHLDQQKLVYGD